MIKNYSGSTKIREKSSIHKRHKFLLSRIFRLRISEEKNHSSGKLHLQQKSRKNFQLTNLPLYPVDITAVRLTSLCTVYRLSCTVHVWYRLYGSHMQPVFYCCTIHMCRTDCTAHTCSLFCCSSHTSARLTCAASAAGPLTRATSLSMLKNQENKTENFRLDLSK
jgi:hypothetical protein